MRQSLIDEENRRQIARQQDFRAAADTVVAACKTFSEIEAIALIGSVAKPLWKEVPRFRKFRRADIEIWHECADVELAVWLSSQHRLGALRQARDLALRAAYEAGSGPGVAGHQVDVFLHEPGSDRYLGRLCNYSECPKGKENCLVPGCGAVAFNKVVPDFVPSADLLAGAVMLFDRKSGLLTRAADLPGPEEDQAILR